jgi:hypothetical protein
MCFRLRRIGDLMAVKERRGPQQHGGGGRREELKGAWAWYEDRVPDVLCQLYGWGPLGGGHDGVVMDGRRLTAPTRHARCVAPGGRADGVANERLSSLAGDAVWQIRFIAGYGPSTGSPSWRQFWM